MSDPEDEESEDDNAGEKEGFPRDNTGAEFCCGGICFAKLVLIGGKNGLLDLESCREFARFSCRPF
jgi:hypothetical protein